MMKIFKLIITCYNLLAFLVSSVLSDVPGPSMALLCEKVASAVDGL